MDASLIFANTVGPVPVDVAHTAVDIQVSQDVALTNGALILTQTSGPGRGGDADITADSLTLENGSFIFTANSELGLVGGDISLNVGELHLLGDPSGDPLFGSQILSLNSTGTDLDGNAVTGVGGKITVQGIKGAGSVADKVEILGGSGIVSETQNTSGDGGRISITANSVDLLGEASIIKSLTSVTGTDLNGDGVVDAGRGGDIVMAVQHLSVLDGAAIRSSTNSESPGAAGGGNVTVQELNGPESQASSVLLSGSNTGITTDSAFGVPGNLTVNAGTLTITNGAVISTGTALSGPTGTVTVTADSVVISADGLIFSQSFAQDAGTVTITANNDLTLDNGSIKTSTSGSGRGGNVELNGGTVSLTNGASINSQSETLSTGRAGDITITAESLALANQAEISSSSQGTLPDAGDAGNITIDSGSTVVMNNSSITTEAITTSGGQIEINAPEMIRLTNSEVSTSVKGVSGESDGGNIKIDPQFVILQNSQLIAQANAGAGGAIDVIAGVFLADPSSLVSASSQSGPQGTVNIQSPVQNIGGELAPMSEEFASAVALLAQQCAARVADGKFSTFVVSGREGLPTEPGGFLASPSLTAELLGSSLSGRDRHTQFPAVTGTFPEYDARPIQLAKFGGTCR
jgi:large exoprotein involved in heme utilization and adhesion